MILVVRCGIKENVSPSRHKIPCDSTSNPALAGFFHAPRIPVVGIFVRSPVPQRIQGK